MRLRELLAVLLCALPGLSHGLELPAEQHPSLLFTADEIPLLRERLQRAPYSTWWATTLQRANAAAPTYTEERAKVRTAKSLAFVYTITGDTSYARRAVELLAATQFPPRGGDMGQPHLEGEIAAQYAEAYDLLHPYLQSDTTALELIRTLLAEEAQRLYAGIRIKFGFLSFRLHQTPDPRNLSVVHLDNWHLRAYSGLGLAAFALADHPGLSGSTPQQWAERAHDLVTRTLDYQIEGTDGGYAEGPFYLRYAADVYLPYMWALKRLSGTDLFALPKVKLVHQWSFNLRLPSGRRPNIDDGHLDDFYGHYLAGLDADGGQYRWDWEQNEAGLYVREFSELDAIALYDDHIPATEPAHTPTVFMPEAGDAVFRSDWSKDATYLLLRGEHGLTRYRGLSHEHPDETSFVLYAGGEMLALDAGYIDFEFHDKVNQGRNHNAVLVDGQGPPLKTLLGEPVEGGEDAYIENTFTSEAVDYAEVRAAYQGVQTRRRVMFVGKRYFVVTDQLQDDQAHTYEWRLHGNGGGTSGGAYERTGNLARWTRTKAELLAYLPERAGQTFSEVDTLHSFAYLQELTHTALRVQQQGQRAEFLAVLHPHHLHEFAPTMATATATGAQALELFGEGTLDVVWLAEAGADSAVVAGYEGELRSDTRLGCARYAELELRGYTLRQARYLRADGKLVFSATDSVDLSLDFSDRNMAGFVRGPETGYGLDLAWAGAVDSVRFGGTLRRAELRDGFLHLELAGAGALSARRTGTAPKEPADFDGSGTVDFADFFLFVDVFGKAEPRFDLDGSGAVDFADFFLFVDAFGRSAGGD
ncbi:MAG: heparinase II/III family protein [Candidatus Latescibacteria bacterium]|nr:heparinase II/III family protein [Candidatus Latescibacterota bacterium]